MSTVGRPQFGSDKNPFDYLDDLLKANKTRIAQSLEAQGHSTTLARQEADRFDREDARTVALEAEGARPPYVQQQVEQRRLQDQQRALNTPSNPLTRIAPPDFIATARQNTAEELARLQTERSYRDRTDTSSSRTARSPFTQDGPDNTASRSSRQRSRSLGRRSRSPRASRNPNTNTQGTASPSSRFYPGN